MEAEREKRFRSPYEYVWIIFAFIPIFNFIAFLWIGIYAKRRIWIMFGLVYLAMAVLLMIGSEMYDASGQEEMTPLVSFMVGCGAISWLVCPIHALIVWKPFLVRSRAIRENRENIGPKPRSELKWEETRQSKPTPAATTADAVPVVSFPIDLNKCTEREFTALPGINEERARNAMSIRTERDGFDSIDDFIDSLNIEPHFAIRIEKLVILSRPPSTSENTSKRMKVDI